MKVCPLVQVKSWVQEFVTLKLTPRQTGSALKQIYSDTFGGEKDIIRTITCLVMNGTGMVSQYIS